MYSKRLSFTAFIKIVLLFYILFSIVACNLNQTKNDSDIYDNIVAEVMAMPSEGVVDKITGKIYLKKRGGHIYDDRYWGQELRPNAIIYNDDEVLLEKGAKLEISFTNDKKMKINADKMGRRVSFQITI